MNVNQIVSMIDGLSLDDKKILYSRSFGFGFLDSKDNDLDSKLMLISLVGLVSYKVRDKNPELSTLDILKQITGYNNTTVGYDFIENLSIIVDDFLYGIKTFNSYGLKNSKEIINKINELINQWIPF